MSMDGGLTGSKSPMEVGVGALCRGDGKFYVECSVQAAQDFCDLTCEAFAVGNSVPAGAYPLTDHERGLSQTWVLELPTMASESIEVRLAPDGRSFEQARLEFSFNKVKWQSRLNYRLRPKRCQVIRDFERSAPGTRFNVEVTHRYESSERAVWRFRVAWNGPSNIRPRMRITDSAGKPLYSDCLFCEFQPGNDEGHSANELYQSVLLPLDCEHFIIEACGEDGIDAGFAVVTPELAAAFRARTSDMMKTASDDGKDYAAWLEAQHASLQLAEAPRWKHRGMAPLFGIVVMASDAALPGDCALTVTLDSIIGQTYGRWEAYVIGAVDLPADRFREDGRMCCLPKAKSLDSAAKGIACDFVAFMRAGDTLDPFALREYGRAVLDSGPLQRSRLQNGRVCSDGGADVLYCDEDLSLGDNSYGLPLFKSRLNIDLLYGGNWVGNLLMMSNELVRRIPACESASYEAQLYELSLRALEEGASFAYVPHVLFHAGKERERGLTPEAALALQGHLARRGIKGVVEPGEAGACMPVRYQLPQPHPLVSIVIPSKDHVELLDACIRSIVNIGHYDSYEIVVVENNSSDSRTFDYYDRIQSEYSCVRVVRWQYEFNYSKIVNFGSQHAKGEYLLFLNNDTELIAPGSLEDMLGVLQRPEVGVVGAKLLFRDGIVQHAGVGVGVWGAAVHYNQNRTPDDGGYLGRACSVGNYSAVTGACQMVKADLFAEMGGYDERFAVGFNDVDFCMRLQREGYLATFVPSALLYHYEFASRGREEADGKKMARWKRERDLFEKLWPDPFAGCDPYTSPNLMRDNTYFRLGEVAQTPAKMPGPCGRVRNMAARLKGRLRNGG